MSEGKFLTCSEKWLIDAYYISSKSFSQISILLGRSKIATRHCIAAKII